ncbi:hypothetical protein E3W66_07575 [Gammaproteobacteria bacterium LSUCC0057]|uniref:Uncharacterized protein n=1 Tax=Gammaproteobacteria bacterium LSUCC0057 TaxID=2559237 RepID=A0A4Y8UHS8_9GAMM|nr:hypothetical protein E3W66_07575 [Gammaproteobacteria bacterium LSUCC0057]
MSDSSPTQPSAKPDQPNPAAKGGATAAPARASKSASAKPGGANKSAAALRATLWLLLLLAAAGGGYYFALPLWQSFVSQQQSQARQIAALEQALAEQQAVRSEWRVELDGQREQLEKLPLRLSAELSGQLNEQLSRQLAGPLANLSAAVQRNQLRLNDLDGNSGRQWQLAELYYFIRSAALQLNFERQFNAAIELLQRADALLAEWQEPAVAPLRAALAADIAALQQQPAVDRDGLHNRLLAVAAQAQTALQQPLAQPTFNPAPAAHENQPPVERDWRARLRQLGDLVGAIFILKRSDETLPEVSLPSRQQLLGQRFALAAEQAAVALWQADQPLYLHSLTLCQQLLAVATIDSAVRAPLQAELAALAAQSVVRPSVSISRSEQALYDWRRASDSDLGGTQP